MDDYNEFDEWADESRPLSEPFVQLDDFLASFYPDPEEPIQLRAFPPKGDSGDAQNLSVSRNRLLDELKLQLDLLDLNERQGLYFCPNAGGTKDSEITRYNAFFCEKDDLSIPEQHEMLDEFPLRPSIRVETLRSVHAYWLCEGGCTESEWREIQAGLIKHFDGDKTIKNPSRVMRLPHFDHVGYNAAGNTFAYTPVQLAEFDSDMVYDAAEMRQALSQSPQEQTESQESGATVTLLPVDPPAASFTTWDELNAEAGRRIRLQSTAKLTSDGTWIHANGICHAGDGNKALYLNLESGAYGCFKGCNTSTILGALNLPARPQTLTDEKPLGLLWGDLCKLEIADFERVIFALGAGEVGLLIASTDVGKSTLAMNLSLHLAAGGKFEPLVEAKVGGRRVMYVDGESRQGPFQWNMKRMMRDWTTDEQALVEANFYSVCDVILDDEPLNLSNEAHFARVRREVIRFQPKLIVVDTSSSLFTVQNENDNAEVSKRIMRPLIKLATQSNAAILLVHHIGKMSEDAQATTAAYRGRGASAFGALPRMVLMLKREPNSTSLVGLTCTKAKGPKFSPVVLRLDGDTRWFTNTSATPSEKPSSYKLVVDTVRRFHGEMQRKEIEAVMEGVVGTSQVGKLLKTAKERGDLIAGNRGSYIAPENAHVLDAIDDEYVSAHVDSVNPTELARREVILEALIA